MEDMRKVVRAFKEVERKKAARNKRWLKQNPPKSSVYIPGERGVSEGVWFHIWLIGGSIYYLYTYRKDSPIDPNSLIRVPERVRLFIAQETLRRQSYLKT